MADFPEKELIQKLMPWLVDKRRNNVPPFVSTAEIKRLFSLADEAYGQLFRWFFEMGVWKPLGTDRLVLTPFVDEFSQRFPITSPMVDFHLLHRFSRERSQLELLHRVLPVLRAARQHADLPVVTLAALLSFGNKTSEGRLVEAVAIPWFRIISLIREDSQYIYEINPFDWEQIIAGAYKAAGFDEVILTPRSGDKGRDVIATMRGLGSVTIIDQVKAYRPGHRVRADDVRAIVGVLHMEKNVSKAFITTTSEFAPMVREDALIKSLIPEQLELRPRDVLLPWLEEIATKSSER